VIVALRAELADAGHDAGPATIGHHLGRCFEAVPSPATVWRILRRHGLITPQPHKRPRSSFVRFEAALPNELWQADTTHWRLADGSDVEILNLGPGCLFRPRAPLMTGWQRTPSGLPTTRCRRAFGRRRNYAPLETRDGVRRCGPEGLAERH
jgi:hypothetical protein